MAVKKTTKKVAKTAKVAGAAPKRRSKKAKLSAAETNVSSAARYVETPHLNTTTGGMETTRSLHV